MAGELLDNNADRLHIEVLDTIARSEANIFVCRLSGGQRARDLCIKQFIHTGDFDVPALYARSAKIQPLLDPEIVASPRFLAFDAHSSTMVMTLEDGEPLEDMIIRSFFLGKAATSRCRHAIATLAVALAQLGRTEIPDDVELARPCSNREYAVRIQEFLQDNFAQECLTFSGTGPEKVIQALPEAFWERHEKRLLHGDFQAKNALVDKSGRIVVIDLDFGRGHPLFDVAQFLTQLIRLSRRWRFPRATRLLESYGEYFLATYAEEGFDYLCDDLPFFMTWAMTFSLLGDAAYPRPIRSYIKHHLQNSTLLQRWWQQPLRLSRKS